ncbi:MAG: hypothetical protein LBT83_06995 [Tannerella sp.]|jgi:predicted nucleic acid-binding protein|nr:hypothetical protein [Tannerella sp.]
MIAKTFIDSNVRVYLFLRDNHSKYLAAERYIEEESINGESVISWQAIIINPFK